MKYFPSQAAAAQYCAAHDLAFVIYNSMVLDVTHFRHPGPQHLIKDHLSQDVTTLFDDTGHSNFAIQMMKGLVIGYLNQGQLMTNPYEKLTLREKELHTRLDQLIDISKPLLPQVHFYQKLIPLNLDF